MSARRGRLGRVVALLTALVLLLALGPATSAAADPVITAAPTRLDVSQRSTMAILTWPAVDGAPGYALDYDVLSSFPAPHHVVTSDTVAVLTGLTPESTYYARVAVTDPGSGTTGAWSTATSFTTGARQYAFAPPALTIESPTPTSVTAHWSGNPGGLDHQVAIGESAEPAPLTSTGGTSFTFEDLKTAHTYYVSVRLVDAEGRPQSEWATQAYQIPESRPLVVASYNVKCHTCRNRGEKSWAQRRTAVASTIMGQMPDVLGVQEASQSEPSGMSVSQFEDLARLMGPPYRVTNYYRYNCARSNSPRHCRYVNRGASLGDRIIYNTSTVTMVKQGSVRLPRIKSSNIDRYLTWAIFRQKSTGRLFLFGDSHLENGGRFKALRVRQADTIIATLKRVSAANGGLPTIMVGDFNTHKWLAGGNKPYDHMLAAGFKDPLGNSYKSRHTTLNAIVEKRINTNYSSSNGFERKARKLPYINGTYLDYIFVTPMRVSEWETVVKVDRAGRFIGTIPSDHNMVRATVWLP